MKAHLSLLFVSLLLTLALLSSCKKEQIKPNSYFTESRYFSEELTCLTIDGGSKWIGTEYGSIMRIGPDFENGFNAKAGDTKLYDIRIMGKDSLLIGRRDAGLVSVRVSGTDSIQTLTTYVLPRQSMLHPDTNRVHKRCHNYSTYHIYQPKGCDTIFLATSNGLFFIDTRTHSDTLRQISEENGPVSKIIEYKNKLFFATPTGLRQYDLKTRKYKKNNTTRLINLFISPDNKLYGIGDYEKTDHQKLFIYDIEKQTCDSVPTDNYLYSIHFFDGKQLRIFSNEIEIRTDTVHKEIPEKAGPFTWLNHFVDHDESYIYILKGKELARIPRFQNFSKSFLPVSCITQKDEDSYYVIAEGELYLYSEKSKSKSAEKVNDLPIEGFKVAAYDKVNEELWLINDKLILKGKNNLKNYEWISDITQNENKLEYNLLFIHHDTIYVADRSFIHKWAPKKKRFLQMDSVYHDLYPQCYKSTDQLLIGTFNLGLYIMEPSGKLLPKCVERIDSRLYPQIANVSHLDIAGGNFLLTSREGLIVIDSLFNIHSRIENNPSNKYESVHYLSGKVIAKKREGFDLFELKNDSLRLIEKDKYSLLSFDSHAIIPVNDSVLLMGSKVGLLRVNVNNSLESDFIPFASQEYEEKKYRTEIVYFVICSMIILCIALWLIIMKLSKTREGLSKTEEKLSSTKEGLSKTEEELSKTKKQLSKTEKELAEAKIWYEECLEKIHAFFEEDDIKLLFPETELKQLLYECQHIEIKIKEKGINKDIVDDFRLIVTRIEEDYIHRKEAHALELKKIEAEYIYYKKSEKYTFNDSVDEEIKALQSASSFEDFKRIKEGISSLFEKVTRKSVKDDLTEIREIKEKVFSINGDEENFRKQIKEFYDTHIKELLPASHIETSEDHSTLNIYPAFLVMHLIDPKNQKLIASLYQKDEDDLTKWRAAVRQRISRYRDALKEKLPHSEYPNHYIIITLKKNIS